MQAAKDTGAYDCVRNRDSYERAETHLVWLYKSLRFLAGFSHRYHGYLHQRRKFINLEGDSYSGVEDSFKVVPTITVFAEASKGVQAISE